MFWAADGLPCVQMSPVSFALREAKEKEASVHRVQMARMEMDCNLKLHFIALCLETRKNCNYFIIVYFSSLVL